MITYTAKPWLTSELTPRNPIAAQVKANQAQQLLDGMAAKGMTAPSMDDLMSKWYWAIGDALTALNWDDEFEFAE